MNINLKRVLILGPIAVILPVIACELSNLQVGLKFLYVLFGVVSSGWIFSLAWKYSKLPALVMKYLYAPRYERSKTIV